jgi:tRNA-Thr(GGU) m(6)t(6)A37 methyltransferase TsaA
MELRLNPIGVIRTPFLEPAGTPIQPSRADGARGTVHVSRQYREALLDLEGFERLWLVYWLHKARNPSLLVTPFLDRERRGLFATRAPARPAPLGISAVRLIAIRGNVLEVADVDMIDGTPLLDIKPYVPEFDSYPGSRAGWFGKSRMARRRADDRFVPRRRKGNPDAD